MSWGKAIGWYIGYGIVFLGGVAGIWAGKIALHHFGGK